jgi:hypothetical protein
MIFKNATVNETGREEIREFLARHHKRRYRNFIFPDRVLTIRDIIHDDSVSYYADKAEEFYDPDCGASFELGTVDSMDGIPHVCRISDEGLDIEEFDDGCDDEDE